MTETSGENVAWLFPATGFPREGAFSIALNIHQALTTGNESAYVYWQMHDGASNATGATLTGSIEQANAPKYNAFKHFSKFIRPNSTRLATSITGVANVLSTAYVNNMGNELTIVLINVNSAASNFSIAVPTSIINGQAFNTFTSRNGSYWQNTTITNIGNSLSIAMPAYSVMTLNARNNGNSLSVLPNALSFPSARNTQNITVSSNVSWIVADNATWLSASTTSGWGNRIFSVAATNNTLAGFRIAQVTVSGGALTQVVNITQAGIGSVLILNTNRLNYSLSVATQIISVNSNITWSATASQRWLTIANGSGSSPIDANNSVSVMANPAFNSRSALVTIAGNGIGKTILINQAASVSTTGINYLQSTLSNPLIISPNPASMDGEIMFNKKIDLKLYNLIGNELRSVHGATELSLKGLKSGVYYIRTIENEVRKLVVE